MTHAMPGRLCSAFIVLLISASLAMPAVAETAKGTYRGMLQVVRFDVSPPLRDIPPIPFPSDPNDWGSAIIDPPGTKGVPQYGPQSNDTAVQSSPPVFEIPSPSVSFDTLGNQGTSTPPDPVGDIGPNHYVTMSNLHFVVQNRTGTVLFGPVPNNTLWSGFGGECQTQNAGDPIILYDQFADRWLLTQFTGNAEPGTGNFYNCIAVSQTPDPMGPWFRWQVSNGTLFPDYPKYGVGEEAYFISTRDFGGGYEGVGAYALNRAQLIAGNPSPTIISFFMDRSPPYLVGDGLLPMDIDGSNFPPLDSPHYYFGTMDDGGPYGAPQDAVLVYAFDVDFGMPANSTFELVSILPMSPYDTIFPCTGAQGRNCIPQPGTAVGLDHQGYRQRPLHRAAYRNFGTHEAIVTNQSVEADTGISGVRWWEVRVVDNSGPILYQEGTFAPGIEDGVHRWFGSAAMDSAGDIALGYSAGNSAVFPSIRYSGRLAPDPLGTMPQGEGEIVSGAGSQLSTFSRWGDYNSMNVDSTDDCTFWYLNEYYTATSTTAWTLRVGAFAFDECDDPAFSLINAQPADAVPNVDICAGDEADYSFNIGSIAGFNMPVTMSASGNPMPTSASFDVNPVSPLPGSTTLTVGNTGPLSAGTYPMTVTATAAGPGDRSSDIQLGVFEMAPVAPTLMMPPDAAIDLPLNVAFQWSAIANSQEYTIEVATDPGFADIVFTQTLEDTMATNFNPLTPNTTYYWRVRGSNACGPSADSTVFSFTTAALPGDCAMGEIEVVAYVFDFEDGAQGWTSGTNLGPDTWALSGANPNDGTQHWHVDDVGESSDTFLTSPVLELPSNLTDLTFRFFNYQDFEIPPLPNCWDGGMLEVSTNGGGMFMEVVNADLLTDPYDGPLQDVTNPLQGRQAWCGAPQPYTDSRVNIDALAGQSNIAFRFRIATDGNSGGPGWDIDGVTIQGCSTVLNVIDGFENIEN